MIRTVVLVVIGLVVIFTALSELGINAAPLLAGASIIGVALGFGSQTLVRDFITGIFLLMENAMQVGDSVTVGGVSGTVEYLSIRTVRLRAGDGSLHIIPFSSVTTVNNVNRGLGTAPVKLNVVPTTDLESTFALLRKHAEEMQADPKFGPLMLGPLDIFGVDSIDGATVTIGGQIRTTDKGRWPVTREFNRRVLSEVVAGRLVLANPRETLLAQAPATAPASDPA
nr:mechanosensitive ion channel domain-containing protein [Verticiella sp. GG226]